MNIASAWKLALARDPGLKLRRVRKVTVPKGTRTIYIPRKHHYQESVFADGSQSLEFFHDLLEPCKVTRGPNGFGWHICAHHRIYIEETQ